MTAVLVSSSMIIYDSHSAWKNKHTKKKNEGRTGHILFRNCQTYLEKLKGWRPQTLGLQHKTWGGKPPWKIVTSAEPMYPYCCSDSIEAKSYPRILPLLGKIIVEHSHSHQFFSRVYPIVFLFAMKDSDKYFNDTLEAETPCVKNKRHQLTQGFLPPIECHRIWARDGPWASDTLQAAWVRPHTSESPPQRAGARRSPFDPPPWRRWANVSKVAVFRRWLGDSNPRHFAWDVCMKNLDYTHRQIDEAILLKHKTSKLDAFISYKLYDMSYVNKLDLTAWHVSTSISIWIILSVDFLTLGHIVIDQVMRQAKKKTHFFNLAA